MDGGPQRTLLLTVRYAAAGIGRQALNVLLIPLYTIYLDPKDFGVLALLTISGTLVLRTVETPVGNALQRFYFRPDYSDRRDVLLFNLVLFAGANVLAVLLLYRLAGNALAALLFHDPALAATVRLHGFVVAFSITTSLTGIFVMLLERSRIYTIASILNVVVTGVVSVSLLHFARLGVAAVVLGTGGRTVSSKRCFACPLLVQHAQPRDRSGRAPRAVEIWICHAPFRLFEHPDHRRRSLYAGLLAHGERSRAVFVWLQHRKYGDARDRNARDQRGLADDPPDGDASPEEQRAFVRQVTTFVCVAGAALAVGLSIFAPELIRLLASRPEFVAAAVVVPLLTFSQALQGLAAFTEAGITLGNKPAYCSVTALAAAAVNLGLGFLLIPRFGILGAGWATLASFVVWNVLQSLFLDEVLPAAVRRAADCCIRSCLGALLVAVAQFLARESEPAHSVAVKEPLGRRLTPCSWSQPASSRRTNAEF